MKDYQPKKNKYSIPQDAYNTTLWIIRGYHRFVDIVRFESNTMKAIEYDKDHVQASPDSDVTFRAAVKIADCKEKINAIETARDHIPCEYRQGVWENVLYHNRYPDDAAESTYSSYRSRFIREVADLLDIV